jgi:Uma2 family endonuclease
MGKSKLYFSHTDEGIELTREEYAEADVEVPWRYERANGRLVIMTPAGLDHHETVEPFRNHLGAYALAHPDVIKHVFQESWTAVEDDTDRLPDIAVYLTGGTGRLPDRVPELIFEIVSQGSKDRKRDYEEKRSEYERIGVQEYVIVDRFDHRLTVLCLEEATFVETVLQPSDQYSTLLLPGLEIPLSGII